VLDQGLIYAAARDISDGKQAEEALRASHAELELRVRERTGELSRANEKLQAEVAERKQVPGHLQRWTEILREQAALLDLARDAIFTRDPDRRIAYRSQGAEALYGWRKEEALGSVSHELLRTKFPIPMEDIEAQVVDAGYWEGELRQAKRDGTEVVVESRWALQRSEDGKPLRILEINRDITEHKRLEQQLIQSQKMSKAKIAASHAKIVRGNDQRISTVNYGFPRQQNGQPVIDATEKSVGFHCRVRGRTLKAEFELKKMVVQGNCDL